MAPIIVLAVAFLIYIMWTIKKFLISALPVSFTHQPASKEEFEHLDLNKLERLTNELQQLGFAELADLKTVGEFPKAVMGFERVFAHPVHKCFAAISQLMQPPMPMSLSISSSMSYGYILSTQDVEITGAAWAQRCPKYLWSNHKGASPAELLQIHLDKRDSLIDKLNLQIRRVESVHTYSELVNQQISNIRESLSSRYALGILIDLVMFNIKPKNEWMK